MPLPPVHFAVGMGLSSALGAVLVFVRRRWLLYLPLVVTLCGALALVPDLMARGGDWSALFDFGEYAEREHSHAPVMNLFFLHPWLDEQHALDTREMTELGFQVVALMYLAAACGYTAFIRWGVGRTAEEQEALSRMRRAVRGYRVLGAVIGIAPLLLTGAALGWVVRTMAFPTLPDPQLKRRQAREWRLLVHRRMGVDPRGRLGLVRRAGGEKGQWRSGDLAAYAGRGAAALADVVERARANGCDFVVIADGALGSPGDRDAYREALERARKSYGGLSILNGLSWDAGRGESAGAGSLVIVPPQSDEVELLGEFHRQFDRRSANGSAAGAPPASSEAALQWLAAHSRPRGTPPVVLAGLPLGGDGAAATPRGWDELFSWQRTNPLFVGFLGLGRVARVSAREARSRWDPRVARVGGEWDRRLDQGFRLWGAAAASGFRDPQRHFWPGEFARTHVWCPGPGAADVVAGLQRGCFWAGEGGMVRALDFEVLAPALERPARMGEVARVSPGTVVSVELALDIPTTDFAGSENWVDEVALVSNFDGEPAVVQRFGRPGSARRLTHTFPPAEDRNGGLGFYVRAWGWRRLDDGSRLAFYTNPIHVLVRDGAPPLATRRPAPAPAVARPAPPESPEPATATTAQPSAPTLADDLKAVGLPVGVGAVHVERFRAAPSRHWRGVHAANAGEQGPAIGDDGLRIEFFRKLPVGEATRLFFRCHVVDCDRVALVVRAAPSGRAYQLVRRVPPRQWVAFDLSLSGDFHPVRRGAAPLRGPGEIEAIEWRAEASGPDPRLHVGALVVYDPTDSSRLEVARRRADALELACRELAGAQATAAGQARADALVARLAAARARLDPKAPPALGEALHEIERELEAVDESCERLRLQAAMARVFGVPDPKLVASVVEAERRVSARHPALRFRGPVVRAGELSAAAGETESFQVVVAALWDKLSGVKVTWSPLEPAEGAGGPGLPASAISAALVGEVEVAPRAELLPEQVGWIPDPLTPLKPFDVEPGGLRSVLLTVDVSADLPPGDYEAKVSVCPEGLDPVVLPVRLHRWDFALVGNHFPVIGPLDERAIRARYGGEKAVPRERRRALYELLLRHRVDPVPLLSGDEEADLADLAFCFERGQEVAVLHEVRSATPWERDSGVDLAVRYAVKIREGGWGLRGALLLPLVAPEAKVARFTKFVNALSHSHPALLVIAGGDGDPPPQLITSYWRRPFGADVPELPREDILAVRRSRSARREAWEIVAAIRGSRLSNLLLINPLLDARLLPWMAWRHGVRALVLRGVTRWEERGLGEGVLVYPFASPEGGPGRDGGPCGSLRLAALRNGVEDCEWLWLLWDRARRLRERAAAGAARALAGADQAATEAREGVGTLAEPCRNPHILAALRMRLGRAIERLEAAWWEAIDAADDLPPPPTDLAARPADAQVHLTWAKSPDEKVAAYSLYRSCDPQRGFVQVNPLPITGLSYVDRSVRNGVTYYYFARSSRDKAVHGPRSKPPAEAAPTEQPRVVWAPMADLQQATVGPYRVLLRLEGPDAGNKDLALVIPQIDYALSDGLYDGFEKMTRQEDMTWVFDIPDLGWRRHGGKKLRIQVRIVDRQNRVRTDAVEREELIDPLLAPR